MRNRRIRPIGEDRTLSYTGDCRYEKGFNMFFAQYSRRCVGLLAVAMVLSACASTPELTPSAAPAGNYTLDPTHTSVTWSLSHAGLSNYTARFDKTSGTLDFDPDNPENSAVFITIDPASVSTGLPDFDQTLATDSRYFDVNSYPEITFVSTQIIKTGDSTADITGDLTFRGVTKPVTLKTKFYGAGKSFGNPGKTLGFSAETTLLRSNFNMTHLISFGIGDEVEIRIETEFNEG